MQPNALCHIRARVHTSALQASRGNFSLKIVLAFVSASGVFTSGMLPINAQATNSPPPLQTSDVVTASIDLTKPGLTIPSSFSGFSLEYGDQINYTGRTAVTTDTSGNSVTTLTVNPVFVQLLKNIANFNNGAPLVRLGGNSADSSWWNPNGLDKPPGIGYNITAMDMKSLEASLAPIGSKVILSLNLGQYNTNNTFNALSNAVAFVKAAQSNLASNRVLAYEVGNEPDIYTSHAYYKDSATGATVNVRNSSYSFNQYLTEFGNYSSALQSSFSTRPPLAGTAFTTSIYGWMQYFPSFLSSQSQMMNLTTYHVYPLSACSWSQPGSSTYPTIPNLLSDQASLVPAQKVATFVNQAKQYGIPLSLSEINSVSCGGTNGVSNSFASALWGADVMFNMASVGVRSVHFHTGSGGYYSPFTFSAKQSSTQFVYTATVNPLYYGMLLFAQAVTNTSQLLPVNWQSTGNVRVWATMDSKKVVRVVAINKDLNASGNARIQLSSLRSGGSLVRLTAASASATTGVAFAGQTFDGTTDGKPVGDYVTTQVTPVNGVYTFSLPAASAALLTISP